MARIIYGPIITDIKGSIGGITFQKNGAGTIARLKPRKVKTNTQKQRDQQPRLKEVQRNWNELTLVNKILWNDFASVNNKIGLDGQEKKLTGYQWFLTINENLKLIDVNIIETPPVYEIINPINNIILDWNQSDLRMIINPSNSSVDISWIIYSSFIINSVSKFDFNKCRFMRTVIGGYSSIKAFANDIGTRSWNSYYNSVFPPSLGNKDFYIVAYLRAISTTSGISSLAYTTISKFVWDGVKYVIE